MTAIVGLVQDGEVFIGGDSAGVAGYSLTVRKDAKVFRNGEFLFGFTSSFRMGQLLRYAFKPPRIKGNLDRYMATTFIDEVRRCLKAGGFAEKNKDAESGGHFLVGVRGRLFNIGSDYQVGESLDDFDAVGCGDQLAYGAMYAMDGSGIDPKARVLKALKAAERGSAGVRGPFVVRRLPAIGAKV